MTEIEDLPPPHRENRPGGRSPECQAAIELIVLIERDRIRSQAGKNRSILSEDRPAGPLTMLYKALNEIKTNNGGKVHPAIVLALNDSLVRLKENADNEPLTPFQEKKIELITSVLEGCMDNNLVALTVPSGGIARRATAWLKP